MIVCVEHVKQYAYNLFQIVDWSCYNLAGF